MQVIKKIYVKPAAVALMFDCCKAIAISEVSADKRDDDLDNDELAAPGFRPGSIWEDEGDYPTSF